VPGGRARRAASRRHLRVRRTRSMVGDTHQHLTNSSHTTRVCRMSPSEASGLLSSPSSRMHLRSRLPRLVVASNSHARIYSLTSPHALASSHATCLLTQAHIRSRCLVRARSHVSRRPQIRHTISSADGCMRKPAPQPLTYHVLSAHWACTPAHWACAPAHWACAPAHGACAPAHWACAPALASEAHPDS